jgi:hypothetical protein
MTEQRESRFSSVGSQSGVQSGFQESSNQPDTLNKKFVKRNLKPYKSLKRYAKPGGLKKLKHKNYAQLERMAAKAVIKKAKVKSKPLNTKINRKKHSSGALKKGKKVLAAAGSENFRPGSLRAGLRGRPKKVKRAAMHLQQLRRNRRVNKTNPGNPRAYDIYKGYRRDGSFQGNPKNRKRGLQLRDWATKKRD